MKKTSLILAAMFLLLMLFCVTVSAAYISADKFTKENSMTLAGFNGTKKYITDAKEPEAIGDVVQWLIKEKEHFNLKYVSVLGQLAGGATYNYQNTVGAGMSVEEFYNLSKEDPSWKLEFNALATVLTPFKDANIPYGISLHNFDYTGNGYNRQSMQADYFSVDQIMPEDAVYEYCDDSNYYTIVKSNGKKYIIFQLELWPQTANLNWFNSTIAEHKDKYAIVFTTSFIDDSGAMYTMWDWENDTYPPLFGTTKLRGYSLTWTGKPRDGEAVWKYAFSKHDNILAVVSSMLATNKDIVTSKVKNERGIETALIAANGDNGFYSDNGFGALITNVSEDNKTITCAWATKDGIIDSSIKTITLDTLGTLAEPDISEDLPKIAPQFNGANSSYILGKGNNKFEPNANMTRAEACTIFARLLLGTQTIPDGYVTRFTDVKKDDWFYNAVAFLDQTGYFFRNKNTTYKPNEPITRAEFVDLANAASTLVSKNDGIKFKDVSEDHFYYKSIMVAAESGLVNGYEDSTFRPDNTITRAEVVTVINRLLGLKANEKTVCEEKLENVFDDIKTHWARYNIMMASNSNVHGDYYYKATLDGVTESKDEITFKNKHFSLSISKKNARITKFINLYTSEDVNKDSKEFVYLSTLTGNKSVANSVSLDGNRVKFSFKNSTDVYMIVEVRDNYMTFEIDSEIPSTFASVTFANISTSIVTSEVDDESFMLNAIGMTAWVDPVNKGFRKGATSTIAHAYTRFDSGTLGSKLGVVFSKRGDALTYLQELTDAIDPSVGIKSLAGGAYAKKWQPNYGDYIFAETTLQSDVDKTIELAKKLGIDQIDIHQGAKTFRQGDMYFYNTKTGTAKEFYEKIGKKFIDAGFDIGLHTYAYYITYKSEPILSDPKWQKDLETLETYTLRKKMTKFSKNAATVEDASSFDMTVSFFYRNSRYILIDEEIILVGRKDKAGLMNLTRGACGTTAAEHAEGTTVYHLSGYFNMFAPKLGSELFYYTADLTAKAYNEGGFSMIYLDAIDGLTAHLENDYDQFYYFQMYLQRIISQCEKSPVLETSSSAPQEWNARARTGAWDTPRRAIKQFIANHVAVNLTTMSSNMTPTLGWFNFHPDSDPLCGMKNTIQKTLFRDDIDFLGMNAIIYNMSMVYNDTSELDENPYHIANINYYKDYYSKLRKSYYFSDKVIEKVKSIGGEWKVIEKGEGEYAFLQMYYDKQNLGNVLGGKDFTLSGNNPFKEQPPFIRIESRWSTLSENEITIAAFDEAKTLKEQTLARKVNFNMLENMAIKVRVKGTGADGDAMLISLVGAVTSGESLGRGDYFIDLNFEGWREFVLLDLDNAEYDITKYKFNGVNTDYFNYVTYRRVPNYAQITDVTVRTCGSTGDKAQIGTIYGYTQTNAPVKNPTITIGSSSITFNTTINGGEYIEFDPITGKAILYHSLEQTIEEIEYTGTLTVPKGDFKATYTAEATTAAPIRAKLVIGFSGEELTN